MNRLEKTLYNINFSNHKLLAFFRVGYLVRFFYSLNQSTELNTLQTETIERLNKTYRTNRYNRYLKLFEENRGWLFQKKLSKYFSWAATVKKGEKDSLEYICQAVSLAPEAMNDLTTSIVVEAFPDKELINRKIIESAMKSDSYSQLIYTYCCLKKGDAERLETELKQSNFRSKYEINELITTYSLLGQYEEIAALYQSNPKYFTLRSYELVYDAFTQLGLLREAQDLFDQANVRFGYIRKALKNGISNDVINNKLERQFWFQKCDLVKAYKTYRRQRLSKLLSSTFPSKYCQTLEAVTNSKSPLVLASWGPGDELRFSNVYRTLAQSNANITISCEPRLLDLLTTSYPEINFLSIRRTRRVAIEHQKLYNKLPKKRLHHLFDNASFAKMSDYSSVSLVTDLLADIVDNNGVPDVDGRKSDHEALSANALGKTQSVLVIGISWRSSLETASRNEHYFSIDQLGPIFEISDAQFVNLQYGDCSKEVDEIEAKYGVRLYQPNIDQFNDFNSVERLMRSLDYVLSAGTTVLELSGFSGAATFALTNNKAFQHRCGDDNRDIWFSNIRYIADFATKGKIAVAKSIARIIRNEKST